MSTAPHVSPAIPAPRAPDLHSPVADAIGEALANAEGYAATGTRFAEMRDLRGLSYAVRSAAACLSHAAELLEELTKAASLKSGGRRQ